MISFFIKKIILVKNVLAHYFLLSFEKFCNFSFKELFAFLDEKLF